MLTVGKDAGGVERLLVEGRLGCPGCGGRLRGWGHARPRVVRMAGDRLTADAAAGEVCRVREHACVTAGQRAGASSE